MGWKTILGGIVSVVGFLLRPEVFALLSEQLAAVVMAAGAILGIFGIRHAIQKSGPQ
jgi:hypothetical protein